MRDLVVLFHPLHCDPGPLARTGGARSIVAESLLLKHQLLILNRSRRRSPNLSVSDRILAGLMALLVPAHCVHLTVLLLFLANVFAVTAVEFGAVSQALQDMRGGRIDFAQSRPRTDRKSRP